MQTLTLTGIPTSANVFVIVNGLTYIVNSTPGVTLAGGSNVIQWDDSITGYLLDPQDTIRVNYGT